MPDREKVINGIHQHCEGSLFDRCGECPYYEIDYSAWGESKFKCRDDLLSDVLSLLKEQEWHTLTEDRDGIIHGLPGDDGQYLMTDGKDIWIDEYMDGVADGIILDSGRDIREITAWMYIPELPKRVGEVR